jgi:hypothetical protein
MDKHFVVNILAKIGILFFLTNDRKEGKKLQTIMKFWKVLVSLFGKK